MQLAELLDLYVIHRPLAATSEYQLRHTLRTLEKRLGRAALIADLTDLSVSRFLQAEENNRSRRSCANLRTNLLCLWRFASDRGLSAAPNRVRRVSRPDPCPIAWTLEELRKILAAIDRLVGRFASGVGRRLYCRALVTFAYDTGLRRSDIWRVTRSQIRPDGSIVMRQHKTQRTHNPRIRESTLELIKQLPGDPPLACPCGTGDWYQFWRREVIKPAGVRHGALQQIRRTGASWLAVDHPEAVQRYLGHRSATMQRHYVDESIARPQQFLPPEIDQGIANSAAQERASV